MPRVDLPEAVKHIREWADVSDVVLAGKAGHEPCAMRLDGDNRMFGMR